VLHQLGRHEQARRELRLAVEALVPVDAATGEEEDRLLLYFAQLFLGAASEAAGRDELAQAAYRGAADVFPAAPAPQLALSQLALRGGDRRGAIEAARRSLRPRADQERVDPWWHYHVLQGRRVESWFESLHLSLESGP
jgi:Flp pilus assembly protein TadD